MKFLLPISHVISHNVDDICEPCEKFDIFISQIVFFQGIDHKYVIDWNFNKKIFEMKGDKIVIGWMLKNLFQTLIMMINETKY